MTDEKFTFVEDVKEKKIASRSARNRIAHTGKGGKVRFPHDNLTRKELEAMNGELRVYRMNDPMKWEDFKTMPVDLQVQYIKAIRNRVELDSCISPSVERIQPPISGRMLFEDRIDNALKTVSAIIGTEYKYRITIKWDRIFDEGKKIGFGNQEDERRREP